jgi:hypothetical protein
MCSSKRTPSGILSEKGKRSPVAAADANTLRLLRILHVSCTTAVAVAA